MTLVYLEHAKPQVLLVPQKNSKISTNADVPKDANYYFECVILRLFHNVDHTTRTPLTKLELTSFFEWKAIDMFANLMQFIVPLDMRKNVYKQLQLWEITFKIIHKWEMEPSAIFLLTQFFQFLLDGDTSYSNYLSKASNLRFSEQTDTLNNAPKTTVKSTTITRAYALPILDSNGQEIKNETILDKITINQETKMMLKLHHHACLELLPLQYLFLQSGCKSDIHLEEKNSRYKNYLIQKEVIAKWITVTHHSICCKIIASIWLKRTQYMQEYRAKQDFQTYNHKRLMKKYFNKWKIFPMLKEIERADENERQRERQLAKKYLICKWLLPYRAKRDANPNQPNVARSRQIEFIRLDKIYLDFLHLMLDSCFAKLNGFIDVLEYFEHLATYVHTLTEFLTLRYILSPLIIIHNEAKGYEGFRISPVTKLPNITSIPRVEKLSNGKDYFSVKSVKPNLCNRKYKHIVYTKQFKSKGDYKNFDQEYGAKIGHVRLQKWVSDLRKTTHLFKAIPSHLYGNKNFQSYDDCVDEEGEKVTKSKNKKKHKKRQEGEEDDREEEDGMESESNCNSGVILNDLIDFLEQRAGYLSRHDFPQIFLTTLALTPELKMLTGLQTLFSEISKTAQRMARSIKQLILYSLPSTLGYKLAEMCNIATQNLDPELRSIWMKRFNIPCFVTHMSHSKLEDLIKYWINDNFAKHKFNMKCKKSDKPLSYRSLFQVLTQFYEVEQSKTATCVQSE